MECPECGIVNPKSAQRCDCGYDFVSAWALRELIADSTQPAGAEGTHRRSHADPPAPNPRQNTTGRIIGGWLLIVFGLLGGMQQLNKSYPPPTNAYEALNQAGRPGEQLAAIIFMALTTGGGLALLLRPPRQKRCRNI